MAKLLPSNTTYKESAHGKYVLRKDSQGYAVGNCYHCHQQHVSVENIPESDGFMEESLCFGCHGTDSRGDGNIGRATDNIESDMYELYGHTIASVNAVMAQANRHRADEKSVTEVDKGPHVECSDCHNPHMARIDRDGRHTVGTNLIEVPGPLEGVDGVDFSTYPSNWTSTVSWKNPLNAEDYTVATMEYQICFKCHSSADGETDNWDNNPGGAGEWTDVALEFNPDNNGRHPVVRPLTDNLDPQQLMGVDEMWAPGSTMYCSDCHESGESAPFGPHGSAVKWMLRGTYTNWPYQDAAKNGTSDPAPEYAYISGTIGSEVSQTFCRNCHPDVADDVTTNSFAGQTNNVHTELTAPEVGCVACHIRVPHGGKVSRLLNAARMDSNLPDRYWPDGDGGNTHPLPPQFGGFTQSLDHRGYSMDNFCFGDACNGFNGEEW